MNRRIGVGIGIVVVVAAVALWRCSGAKHGEPTPHAGTVSGAKVVTGGAAGASKPKVDPRTQARGSIAGTVRDDAKAPIAGATVCADTYAEGLPHDVEIDPQCVTTDANGTYVMKELLAAKYQVTAGKKTYRPAVFREGGDKGKATFALAAGQARTGVDLVLHAGGVELTGTVADITGGPVANAMVRASAGMWGGVEGPITLTDKDGRFALTVAPGTVRAYADADGYARAMQTARAPGTVALLLTPESTLSGTVVDGRTGVPVEGADVVVAQNTWFDGNSGHANRTDDKGVFRVNKLTPGRYKVTARTDHGYGQSDGSTLVGLGQHVDGVVVKLFPAVKLGGKVVIAGATPTPCPEAGVWLRDERGEGFGMETEDDGTLTAKGVLPGTYTPQVSCEDHRSRDHYDPVVVADKDLTDLVWEVDEGATLRGKVVTKRGEPVVDALVQGHTEGGAARDRQAWIYERSKFDGTYEATGLGAGTYSIDIASDAGLAPADGYKLDIVAGKTLEHDFVLDDGGTIAGTVVDAEGKPVPDVTINAIATKRTSWMFGNEAPHKTDATGAFTLTALAPGEYRVIASQGAWWGRALRKPGSTDDDKQGTKATVRVGETATVKLVVESQSAWIKGSVVDAAGTPVSDAYLSSARESDAAGAQQSNVSATRDFWGDDHAPALTATDGTFSVDKLSPGKYTLRAYRKGGGEAVAEHVATGTAVRLQIKPTGSIEGIATRSDGTSPPQLSVELRDAKTGFARSEELYRTDGRFTVHDLPAGAFRLTVSGGGTTKVVEVALAEGEAKTGIKVTLEQLIDVTGRVIDADTQQPVEGIAVFAGLATGGGPMMMDDEHRDNISDKDGRFTAKRVPAGQLALQGYPKDWKLSPYSWLRVTRTATGSGTVDIGDLPIRKKRLQPGQERGDLGVKFKDQPDDTPPDQEKLEISFIDPAGPAANSGLRVGDVIVSVDGVDVTGDTSTAWSLMMAPVGTVLKLGLARGDTVSLKLGPAS